MSRLSFSLLGSVSIALDHIPVTRFRSEKARALLIYLAVESQQPHRRETLRGLFWGDQTDAAAGHNLSQTLIYLQQTFGKENVAEFLDISRATLQFKRESDWWMDADELLALLRVCEQHSHRSIETCPACLARLHQAAALYRGEFLAQFFVNDSAALEEWLVVKREYFLRQVMVPLGILVAYYEQQGQAALNRVIRYARQQIELEPWCEEPHRALMRAYAARGDPSSALTQYRRLAKILSDELGVEPSSETNALYKHLRALNQPLAEIVTAPGSHLPTSNSNLPLPTTPLVGRGAELAQLSEQLALADCRLLTLLGAGGMGKTRLAIQLARENRLLFPGGVVFVDLADVATPDLIPGAMAAALQFSFQGAESPQNQIIKHLGSMTQDLVLLLDNFEQLVAGVGLLDEILKRAPHVTMLVTSREKLSLQGEWVFPVEGLNAPAGVPAQVESDWDISEAVQLFIQCAARAGSRAEGWSPAERRGAMHTTQLVEGMPLAIELAAAWVRMLTPIEIANEIERGLDILVSRDRNVPKRHMSIRAVFEQSWQLLSVTERHVLTRLSVFRGGFTREAAHEVAGALLGILSGLADKSLIKRTTAGRYRLHELVRQFAAEKLMLDATVEPELASGRGFFVEGASPDADFAMSPASGRAHSAQGARHAVYYLALLERYGQQLNGAEARPALERLRHELENLRAAWHSAVARTDGDALLRAVPHLSNFFEVAGLTQEGEALFFQTLEQLPADNQALSARLYASLALFRHQAGNYTAGITAAQAAVQLGQAANDVYSQAVAQEQWGVMLYRQFLFGEARVHLEQALSLAKSVELVAIQASAQLWLANVFESDTDYATAERLELDALRLAENIGDQRLTSRVLSELARVANRQFHYARAAQFLERALPLKRLVGDPYGEARVLINLGVCMWAQYRPEAARRYQLQALNLVEEIGDRAGAAVTRVNLAEGSLWLGNYDRAMREYEAALGIGREIGQRWVEFSALWGLGMAHHLRDENPVALPYAEEYLEQTRFAAMREEEGQALIVVAHVSAALGDIERAAESYQAAETLLCEVGQSGYALQATAGLADLARVQGNLEGALETARSLQAQFDTIATLFDIEPIRILLTCYCIFRACDTAGTDDFLSKVYSLLQERALAIEDSQLRRMYLENVPWHRALQEEWRNRRNAAN